MKTGGGGVVKKLKTTHTKPLVVLCFYNYSFSALLPVKVKGIESQCRSLKAKMFFLERLQRSYVSRICENGKINASKDRRKPPCKLTGPKTMKNIVEYRQNPGKGSNSRNLRFKRAQKM